MPRRTWTLLFTILATTGCGGDDDDDIAFEDVPAEVANVFCAQRDPCLGQLAELFGGGSDCNEEFAASFADSDWARIEAAIEAGTVVYHSDRAQACIDAFAALGCDVFTSRPPDECEEAVEGTVALDGDCNHDAECVGTAYCKIDAECPGTCAAREGAGADCEDDDACDSGLTCQNGECAALAGEGEDCGGTDAPECDVSDGLFCVGQDEERGTSGTCQRTEDAFTAAEGEDCHLLEGPFCVEGISCVLDAIEQMQPVFVCVGASDSGGDCKFGFPDPCPDGEACDANPIGGGDIDGTCVPLGAAGDPCTPTMLSSGCADGLVCDEDGNCTEVHRIGESCDSDAGCHSGNCESSVCAEPPQCEAEE